MFKDNALFCIAHFKPFAKFATLIEKSQKGWTIFYLSSKEEQSTTS
jgi:hypothetical protein